MVTFLRFVIVSNLFLFVATETLEIEISNSLSQLEDQTYIPISVYLSNLARQLENLITNFSNYELDAAEVIHSYTGSVKDDVYVVSEIFKETGLDTSACEENLHENFKQIVRTALEDSKLVIHDGITKGQQIISEAKNVFMTAQNRTVAVKLKIQNCMSVHDVDTCLIEAFGMIILLERTLPNIIASTGHQHEVQLTLLEQEIVAALEIIVVKVFNSYVDLLDEFHVCVLQWD